jgi:Raf kinase inhibitor-like YbhB/YbcL family protein
MDVLHAIAKFAGKAIRPVRAGERQLVSRSISTGWIPLVVRSPDFEPDAHLPEKFASADAPSPALRWSGDTSTAKEIVIIAEDPDAPLTHPFVHWIVYGIAPTIGSIGSSIDKTERPLNAPRVARQGLNSAHRFGFVGATPPPGHGPHRYHFQIFALDQPVTVDGRPTRDDIVKAMNGHVIGFGEIVATFERT